MTRPRLLLGIALLVVALTAGYLLAGTHIYDMLSVAHPNCDGHWTGRTPASFSLDKVNAQPYRMSLYESVTIPSRDAGISLSAWWIPSDAGATAPAVVIVHGLNSCKREGALLLAAGMLHRHGDSVLLFDLRNHGDSTIQNGRYAGGTKEYRDVLGAWDWLINTKSLAPAHIGLMGFSLGAATALIATGEESRVAAMWEDSSYADIGAAIRAELARNSYPTWFEYAAYVAARVETGDDLTALSPVRAVLKLHGRPLFITQGTADTRLSVQYATDLANAYRAAGGTVDPWIVPGSEHTAAIVDHPAEYEQRLVAFFDRSIGPP
jgi:dipeptidyl aminopeptidase/acylaminoacyl peptidase